MMILPISEVSSYLVYNKDYNILNILGGIEYGRTY